MIGKAVLGLGVAAALGLGYAFSRKAKAADGTTPHVDTKGADPALEDRIASVLATEDVAKIRALAKELCAKYPDICAQLYAEADRIASSAHKEARAKHKAKDIVIHHAEVIHKDDRKETKHEETKGLSPIQLEAKELATYLTGKSKGSEDKSRVKKYQQDASMDKPDGMYGPKTRVSLAGNKVENPPPSLYMPYYKNPRSSANDMFHLAETSTDSNVQTVAKEEGYRILNAWYGAIAAKPVKKRSYLELMHEAGELDKAGYTNAANELRKVAAKQGATEKAA